MHKDIPALTGLRALAALLVLLHHQSNALQEVGGQTYFLSKLIGNAGFLGVDIFFVLSGFILAHNYGNSRLTASLPAYGGFLWKRLARVYPVHIAALLLYCFFLLCTVAFDLPYGYWYRLNWTSLLQHLTLTHAWTTQVPKSWNVVSWSISAEWAAYLCFPVLVLLAGRFRSARAAGAIIVLLLCALASNVYFTITGPGGTMRYGFIRIAVEFPAGVLLYRIWAINAFRTSSRFDVAAVAATVIIAIGGSLIANVWGRAIALTLMPVFACALVYSVAASSAATARILSSTVMGHLGRISYAYYMVHTIPIMAVATIALKYNFYARPGVMLALLLAAALVSYACAVWFYRSIEEPARHWLLSRNFRFSGWLPSAALESRKTQPLLPPPTSSQQ